MNNLTLGGLPIAAANLQFPPVHIPDGKGGAYKTELALFRSPERTEKIIWWHSSDPRAEPHNHPWPFVSTILYGGYTEDRWWKENGVWRESSRQYRAGEKNDVASDVFHNVREVLPGTVTHLVCGAASEGNLWGYISTDTKEYVDAERDPAFVDALRAINPYLKR